MCLHETLCFSDVVRDFTDIMIKDQKRLINEGEKDAEKLTEDHLAWILLDFYNGGQRDFSTKHD